MKSALFVDFDNVFSQLRQLQPEAAERFARHPADWLNWLIASLALPEPHERGSRRRLLVRRCYLNPNWYQNYRHAFLRAGFEVVDCPPVTLQGKTSTDIHMVLDIVDLLQHETHYDEFIVFSADADFTPVLRKLRRYDRRTTVLAIGFPSAAYQASADLMIDERVFLGEALGLGAANANAEPAEVPGAELRAQLEAVRAPVQAVHDADNSFSLIREVCALTGAPVLAPAHLHQVISILASELATRPFDLAGTVQRVCDRCLHEAGLRVPRRDVTFLVRGMQLNGHVFGQGRDDVATLAGRLLHQMIFLCEREQKLLSEVEIQQIRQWVGADAALSD